MIKKDPITFLDASTIYTLSGHAFIILGRVGVSLRECFEN